ncbi:exonuclease domain-containing protein [Pseudolysinimonas sp.]|uniref:exonuclease domain-containing protein n=1 Tax=Pseudolysinimonas sp. TaxID=2680009 RepID=UPI003F7E2DEA
MSTWDGPLGVFDLETTGVDTDTARIVSACIAVLDADGGPTARWDWLLDPGVEVPEAASAVHGITTERARSEGRRAEAAIGEIAQTIRVLLAQGVPLVVYNAPYDLTLLDRECRRHGLPPIAEPAPVIDPLVIDKALDRYRKGKRILEATAEVYGVELDGAHDAAADAICAGRVAQALARRYPEDLDLSVADLHGRQEIWYVEQAANFEEYVRTKPGRERYVADRSWPVRPVGDPNTFVDTQPIPPLPPQPGRVPILDFSEIQNRALPQAEAVPQAEDLRRSGASPRQAPSVPLADLVGALSIEDEIDVDFGGRVEPDVEGEETPEPSVDEADSIEEKAEPDVEPEPVPAAEPDPAPATPSDAPRVTTVLRLAAAIVTDPAGRALLVRKRGTERFMQPGGKVEPGESAVETLTRELREELGLELDPDKVEYLGIFRAEAANEPDTLVSAAVFALVTDQEVAAQAEIDEILWIDSAEVDVPLAPLSSEQLLPLWQERRESASGGGLF